jgi:hypothetical protein
MSVMNNQVIMALTLLADSEVGRKSAKEAELQ